MYSKENILLRDFFSFHNSNPLSPNEVEEIFKVMNLLAAPSSNKNTADLGLTSTAKLIISSIAAKPDHHPPQAEAHIKSGEEFPFLIPDKVHPNARKLLEQASAVYDFSI